MSSNLLRDSVFENHSYARQNATCPLASEFSPNLRSRELTILTVINAVQSLSGVSLNSMALFILVTNSSLVEVPANIILCSLVVNDLVSSTIFLPYHAYLFRQSCVTLVEIRTYRTAAAFCSTWSVLNCLAITADRLLAILYPLRYNSLIVALKARVLVVLAVGITTVFTLSLNKGFFANISHVLLLHVNQEHERFSVECDKYFVRMFIGYTLLVTFTNIK